MLTSQEIIDAVTRGINLAIIDKKNSGVSDIRALLMLLDYGDIGENVFSADEISLKNKISISAQLKRRVKAHEMAVVDILEDADAAGCIFTTDRIVYWYNYGENYTIIPYEAVIDADYSGEYVTLKVFGELVESDITEENIDTIFDGLLHGGEISLYTGSYCNDEYSKFMYMYIMDICDWLIKNNEEEQRMYEEYEEE